MLIRHDKPLRNRRHIDRWRWSGIVTYRHRDPRTGLVLRERSVRNLITNAGLNWVRDTLRGLNPDPRILYLEWGTGTTAAAAGDSALETPVGRAPLTSYIAASTGEARSICFLNPEEAVGTWEEWGWFGGPSASATLGSGVLIARVLDNVEKSNLESLEVDRKDVFA